MSTSEQNKSKGLAAEVRAATGLNPACCYQCAKCSAGCPMAEEMSQKPHDIMRLVLDDERAGVLGDDSIWLCLTCETCTARCPNECDPARVIDSLREIALKENPANAPRAIRAFHEAFLRQIRNSGRLFETGVVVDYKLHGGPLFQDVFEAPGMLARGKLGFVPKRIRNLEEIRKIFKACASKKEEQI